MKISEKEKALFDYMQEQANNLLDYCERNGIKAENPGFFVDPSTGYANISARVKEDGKRHILNKSKGHNKFGGAWETGITIYTRVKGEENE